MTNSIPELAEAKLILAVGTNTTETHPILANRVKEAVRAGAKLIVADPRRIDLAGRATRWLRLRVGTDTALFNAMARVIIEEGLESREFIEQHTEGFEEFRQSLQEFTPEYAERITGVPAEDIVAAAREYASTKPAAIIYTMGITQHTCGVQNVQSLSNLCLLCGNYGLPSSGVNPLRGQNNVQGACDMGCGPADLPGYQKIANDDVRRRWEQAWSATLPDRPGLTKIAAIDAMLEGKIKAVYVMGENSLISEADASKTKRALEAIDFLIVQDLFLTETAALADVVLPAASFAETDGTFTNTERRVQLLRKAVEPPGQAREDWRIVAELSTCLGYPMSYESASQVWDEVAGLTPPLAGISYERLEGEGIQWPCPTAEHPGTAYLHSELWEGKQTAYFRPVGYTPPDEQPDETFPLLLTTGRRLAAYHTHTMTGRTPGIRVFLPEETAEINPSDGRRLGIEDGQTVRIVSRRGEVTATACLTERSAEGVVFLSFHFPDQTITNLLTNDAHDPIAHTPEYKACAVRVESVRDDGA
jgi:predicted molibdopterin-dependent oxidoreductase YjgC